MIDEPTGPGAARAENAARARAEAEEARLAAVDARRAASRASRAARAAARAALAAEGSRIPRWLRAKREEFPANGRHEAPPDDDAARWNDGV